MESEDTTDTTVSTDFSDVFDLLSVDSQQNLPMQDYTGNESTVMSCEGTTSLGTGNGLQVVEADMNLETIFDESVPVKAGQERKSRRRSRERSISPFIYSPKT